MTTPAAFPTVTVTVKIVPAETIYKALAETARRRILTLLSDGQARSASELNGSIGKRFDATVKHLIVLRKAGLVVCAQDTQDRRRQAYSLAPSVVVSRSPEGNSLDFGYCLMRF